MRYTLATLLAALASAALAVGANAQMTHGGAGMGGGAMQLPQPCLSAEAPPMGGTGMGGMGMMEGHRMMMMQGMMETHAAMMQGMMNEDPDLAFACGMIPHHQAAIRMAEAQLAYGQDQKMRTLAHAIIAAQQGEIDQLTAWIEGQADGDDHDDH